VRLPLYNVYDASVVAAFLNNESPSAHHRIKHTLINLLKAKI